MNSLAENDHVLAKAENSAKHSAKNSDKNTAKNTAKNNDQEKNEKEKLKYLVMNRDDFVCKLRKSEGEKERKRIENEQHIESKQKKKTSSCCQTSRRRFQLKCFHLQLKTLILLLLLLLLLFFFHHHHQNHHMNTGCNSTNQFNIRHFLHRRHSHRHIY